MPCRGGEWDWNRLGLGVLAPELILPLRTEPGSPLNPQSHALVISPAFLEPNLQLISSSLYPVGLDLQLFTRYLPSICVSRIELRAMGHRCVDIALPCGTYALPAPLRLLVQEAGPGTM